MKSWKKVEPFASQDKRSNLQTFQHGKGFIIRHLVIIRRTVAGGEFPGFLGIFLCLDFVLLLLQRVLGEEQIYIRALQDVAAALSDGRASFARDLLILKQAQTQHNIRERLPNPRDQAIADFRGVIGISSQLALQHPILDHRSIDKNYQQDHRRNDREQ